MKKESKTSRIIYVIKRIYAFFKKRLSRYLKEKGNSKKGKIAYDPDDYIGREIKKW